MKRIYPLMRLAAVLLLAQLYSNPTVAQQIPSDSATSKLSARLSINREKAAQVQAAHNYRHEEITLLMKRTDLDSRQKQAQLRVLLNQRRAKLDSVMTPELKAKLRRAQPAADSIKQAEFRQSVQRQHEKEMNRVPHQHRAPGAAKDSTRTKVKPVKS